MTGVYRDLGGDWPKTRDEPIKCHRCRHLVSENFMELGWRRSREYAAGGIATVSGVDVFHRACGEAEWLARQCSPVLGG